MKSILFFISFITICNVYSQSIDAEVIKSLYDQKTEKLFIDVKLKNLTGDTLFIVDPNEYLNNPYVNRLVSDPYHLNIFLGDECQTCNTAAMEGDMDWYRDFSTGYVMIIPPHSEVTSKTVMPYSDYYFIGKGSFKLQLLYNFNEEMYDPTLSDNDSESGKNSVALLNKMTRISFIAEAEITIKE